MTPIVSFVSSGPGDPDLLTMKAIKRIKTADLIFYDDLSAGEILELASESTTLFSVGKRAGLNSPKQSQVSTLLVNYGKTGKKIVRLKSGDSGIFSRLEEEIVALEKIIYLLRLSLGFLLQMRPRRQQRYLLLVDYILGDYNL